MPEVALYWEKHFEWALNKHNRIYKEQMPNITPHVCRHTCGSKNQGHFTKMAEKNIPIYAPICYDKAENRLLQNT